MAEFFDRTVDRLRDGLLGPLVRWIEAHPRLAAWIVLALGMVTLLVIEARDVGLLPGQWVALIVATVLVAGACIWIISWEDEDEMDDDSAEASSDAEEASDAGDAEDDSDDSDEADSDE